MKITIPGTLPTLNEYILAERTNRFKGAKMKKEATELVTLLAKGKRPSKPYERVDIGFHWFVKNKKKDPDNVVFAKKFILDGLTLAGIIENDGWNNIRSMEDVLSIDDRERVEVTIEELFIS